MGFDLENNGAPDFVTKSGALSSIQLYNRLYLMIWPSGATTYHASLTPCPTTSPAALSLA